MRCGHLGTSVKHLLGMAEIVSNYLLLCSIHKHISCPPPPLHLERWYAATVEGMEEEAHLSNNLHLGCRSPPR